MTQTTATGTLKSIGVKVFWALMIWGLIGSTFMMFKMMTGKPPRPDISMGEKFNQINGRVSVSIQRFTNSIYQLDKGWAENETPSYPIGQMEDMLTALTISQLHDTGMLAVTDTVLTRLPQADQALKQITIAQLLTHTSGIQPAWRTIPEGTHLVPNQESVYSALNYQILRQIVEAVTRMNFPSYVSSKILGPLELPDIRWDATAEQWLATPKSLMTFEEYLNSNRTISLETHLLAFTVPKLADGRYGLYNYGWEVLNKRGLRMERIFCDENNKRGVIMRFPEKNFAAVVLYDGPDALDFRALSEWIAVLYLEREMPMKKQSEATRD